MSVHCHSCDWSQDDFWDFSFGRYGYFRFRQGLAWKYNPFSLLLSYAKSYGRPAPVELDPQYARDMGWPQTVHSWRILWNRVCQTVRRLWRQEWWTWNSWQRDINRNGGRWPKCPRCHADNLDIC